MLRLTVLILVGISAMRSMPVSAQSVGDDSNRVLATFEALRSALNSGNAEGFMSNTTDDVMLVNMSGTGKPSVGRDAVRAAVTGLLGTLTLVWDGRQTQDIAIVDDLAFYRYTAVLVSTPKKGGETSRTQRRYTDILRRDASGQWRLWQHIFVTEPMTKVDVADLFGSLDLSCNSHNPWPQHNARGVGG